SQRHSSAIFHKFRDRCCRQFIVRSSNHGDSFLRQWRPRLEASSCLPRNCSRKRMDHNYGVLASFICLLCDLTVNAQVVEYMAFNLLSNYASDSEIKGFVDKYDFYIFPMV